MKRFKKGLSTLLVGALAIGTYVGVDHLVGNVKFAQAEEQVAASKEELKKVDDIAQIYRAVGKAVEPSVVNIEVHKTIKGIHRGMTFDDDLLKEFFKNRGGGNNGDNQDPPTPPKGKRPAPDDSADEFEQVAGGSGVIMEASGGKGYILTNNHVAGGAETMTIELWDGRKINKAKVLGTDPKTDLAVIQIEADKLIPASWGDSDKLEKGDVIFAFGSPFGYVGSMTHGIVSALNRDKVGILGRNANGFKYENFIQVDAPINPGNSGGPLVNLRGEVVGINTAIATETGQFAGIGFAIPSNQARPVYGQLRETGKVVRGYIGVKIGNVSEDPALMKRRFGFNDSTGVLVSETYSGTPAFGKLEGGDIVTAINGKKVSDMTQLRNQVAATKPGNELTFTIWRDEKSQDVKIKIGEQPEELAMKGRRTPAPSAGNDADESAPESAASKLGLHITTANDDLIARFGLAEGTKGALITSVDRKSVAARAGLNQGDVITQVDREDVENAKQTVSALAKQDLSKGIPLSIVSPQGGSRFVLLSPEEK